MKKLILILLAILYINTINAQWQECNRLFGGRIVDLKNVETYILARSSVDGILLTTDNGLNWNIVNNGLPSNHQITSLEVNGSTAFVGTGGGVFYSSNNGIEWDSCNSGITDKHIDCLTVMGNSIFAGTYSGKIFKSTNNGTNWFFCTDLHGSSKIPSPIVRLFSTETNIIARTYYGSDVSTDGGSNWNSLKLPAVSSVVSNGANIYAGTYNMGVYLSKDNGKSWSESNTGLTDKYITSLAILGETIFAGTYSGIFISTNNGASWETLNDGLGKIEIESLVINETNIYAGTSNGRIYKRSLSEVMLNKKIKADQKTFNLYPNPVKDKMIIEIKNQSKIQDFMIAIYNTQGQIIFQQALQQDKTEINISELSRGIYFLMLNIGDNFDFEKFLKE